MQFNGEFTHKDISYTLDLVETEVKRRVDLKNVDGSFAVSVIEDNVKGGKVYCGDLDLFYAYERLMREARQFRFQEEEIEEYSDFDEGKVLYVCNQKNERFEYNFKSENSIKIERMLRSPTSKVRISLTDATKSNTTPHLQLKYEEIRIQKSDFNEDSLILSRIATLSELREKFDLSWMKKKVYLWMEDIFMFNKYIKELEDALVEDPSLVVDIDTETTGLDYYYYPKGSETKDKLVSIVMTWKKDFAIYIPLGHKYENNLPMNYVIKRLMRILKFAKLRTQYGTYDWKVFREFKDENGDYLSLNIEEDLLLQHFIIQPNPRAGSRSLKDKAWEVLGIKQLSLSDLFPATKDGGKLEIRFELLPRELAVFYACPDVDLMRGMSEIADLKIPDVSRTVYKAETRYMPIVASAEYYGLKIDMKHFQFEKKLCQQLTDDLEEAIYTLAGYRFNLNSPDQVGHFLYDKLGCEMLVKSKSNPNKGSTSSKALKNLAKVNAEEPNNIFDDDIVQVVQIPQADGTFKEERRLILEKKKLNKKKYPEVDLILEYRNYSKLLSSFFNSIEESNKGGRLYSWINQTGAQTGRTISPLQTLPPFIKHMIIPDTSEHGFLIMDYKQVELRLMFGLAGETNLIDLSENPDNDIHRIVAAQIHKKELWEISSGIRKKSKTLNFGIPYALGDRALAEALYGLARTMEEELENVKKAREDKRQFFEAMPRVERLFIDTKDEVRRIGCIYTLTGRGAFYDNLLAETNKGKIARTLRQAGNFMIQGLGADLFKIGTANFQERVRKRGWDRCVPVHNAETGEFEGEFPYVRSAFFVHDELGTVYHKKSIHPCQVLYELKQTMQMKMKGFPTLFIGPCVVRNWGEAKEDKFEIPIELLQKWCDEVEAGMYTEPIDNPEDWVYEEIVKYKTEGYIEHLNELSDKLKAEGTPITARNIAKIFRHSILSHDMMSMYEDKDFEKEFNRKPDHVEHLEWSVEKYVIDSGFIETHVGEVVDLDKYRTISADPLADAPPITDDLFASMFEPVKNDSLIEQPVHKVVEFKIPNANAYEEDKNEMLEFVDELEEYSNPIDVKVAYNFDDTSDDEYSDGYANMYDGAISDEEYQTRAMEILQSFNEFIFTMGRKKLIKVDGIEKTELSSIIKYLQSIHVDNGLYEVAFMIGGKTKFTNIKVDKLDDTMLDIIIRKSQDKVNNM